VALILIVDDDEDMRLSLEALVQSIGHEAAIFDSGTALLAYSRLQEAGCVISDLRMPGMSGLELLQHLAQRIPGVPVILISAYVTDQLMKRAALAGAQCLLKKPIAPADMIDKLRAILARPK
jgi:FixJ family two-component response regulator